MDEEKNTEEEKPVRHPHRWKPGESGNPRGPLPHRDDPRAILRKLYAADDIDADVGVGKNSVAYRIARKRLEIALNADQHPAIDSLLDQIGGKPAQHTTSENKTTVQVERIDPELKDL